VSAAITRPLLEAFTGQRVADIGHCGQTGARSEHQVEVHYLY